ncbi:hypothetical protein FC84_GL001487 [Lapidilactobacillus dextrinicus DSM 20335]|uniref:Cytidine deaminase n=1 Tax=Lapidilactobacillus dextrinicus DSM 20335 TaxID=1423738 RepID=A0A0R2BJ18_9LACO|nr:cytidine deaminase [Lapidilactobacillus dextrinicus]KRM79313.1 hypothetical protein FC84_GL001487 [Lapidilactobacillus dextrinicus DSM 20335]QFG46852.1 cytidine deaminase [Lapidilactobacillus dextrinicus]
MNELIEQAQQARRQAYVPYSHFAVGAAVLTDDGKIFQGCNIENGSYGMTICAERVAMFNAVLAGYHHFKTIAVTGDTHGAVSPCGACRQVMTEFMHADDQVILTNLNNDIKKFTVDQILPYSFSLKDDPIK